MNEAGELAAAAGLVGESWRPSGAMEESVAANGTGGDDAMAGEGAASLQTSGAGAAAAAAGAVGSGVGSADGNTAAGGCMGTRYVEATSAVGSRFAGKAGGGAEAEGKACA